MIKDDEQNDEQDNEQDNIEPSNGWLVNYPKLKAIGELSAEIAKVALNMDSVVQNIKKAAESLTEVMRPLVSQIYSEDFFDNIRKSFKLFADGVLISRLETMGMYEWCNIDEWIKLDSTEVERESGLRYSDMVILKLEREKNFDSDKLDRFIGRKFTKEILRTVEDDTALYLEKNDADKFRKAMVNFRARRYLDSANLLASLIDAQNIKQELFDVSNNKYSLENYDKKHNKPNVSQGWRAFYIVFSNNFAVYFDGEKFNGKSNGKDRQDGFTDFVNNIRGKIPSNENITAIVALSFCLLRFFEDSDFTDYPEYIPSAINRHWLMHGMYDIEDVTRYDCIKLLLMLNQISRLYAKLKNGEI